MGTSDSKIDAAAEIGVDGFVFWFATSSCFGVQGLDKLSEFPIDPNDRLEIQSTTFESDPDGNTGYSQTYASLTNASQSPEYTMPRSAFSNKLSAYTSSAWRSTGVIVLYHPTPDVFRLLMTLPTNLVGKYAFLFLCWLATALPCFVCTNA